MSRRAPTLHHRLEHLLYRAVVGLGRLFAERAARWIGAALGRLAYRPLGIRRRIVETHLRQAFPDRDDRWIRATAAASYAHLGREAMRMLLLSTLWPEDVIVRTRVDGLDEFMAALEKGRGLVLVTGHFGNWEIGGAALAARGVPLDVVAQRQSNPLFDRSIVEARERLGMRVIERRNAPREGLRALRRGRAVAFVADQDARRAGVFVPFFGRLASTHRGPALLALRTGAPIFLGTMVRVDDESYHVRLEEIDVQRDGETEAAIERLTAAFTHRLELAVRASPAQYFWHHRRWKTRPDQEPAAEAPGITPRDGVSTAAPREQS